MANDQGFAIGIDLGTTYSCVAVSRNRNRDDVEIIQNFMGSRTTPSYVSFTSNECLVGEGAKINAAKNPKNLSNTVFDAKRLIGRRYHEPTVKSDMELWPFNVIAGEQDKPIIAVEYKGEQKKFSAEEISSMVLSKMKECAERFLNCEVKNAVITVPAYFNNSQRQSTKLAGENAGLNVMSILNEPSAAAVAYGLNLKACGNYGKKNVLVFDLGGGTFDVSVLEIENGSIVVKATAGDTHLGGEDFDNRLVNHFVEMFRMKHNKNIRENKRSLWNLKLECEKAKVYLSTCMGTDIVVNALYDGKDFEATLSRAKFENLNLDLFERCIEIVKKCLEDANMEKERIDEVVLVGGSTRIPKVQDLLSDFFRGKKLNFSINADEAVAHGAAIEAARLGGNPNQNRKDFLLLDVTPLSLGVSIRGGLMSFIVRKNTRIPTMQDQEYTTTTDKQTAMMIKVYEGERCLTRYNNLLGELEIDGITPAPAGVANVVVSFLINRDGILEVSAKNRDTGKKVKTVITDCIGNHTQDEIDRTIMDGREKEFDDNLIRKRLEAINALDSYAHKVSNAVDKSNLWYLTRKKLKKAARSEIAWSEEHENDKETDAYDFDDRRSRLENLCKSYKSQLGI